VAGERPKRRSQAIPVAIIASPQLVMISEIGAHEKSGTASSSPNDMPALATVILRLKIFPIWPEAKSVWIMVSMMRSPIGPPSAATAEPNMASGRLFAVARIRKPKPRTTRPEKRTSTRRRIGKLPTIRLPTTLAAPYAPTMRPYAPIEPAS